MRAVWLGKSGGGAPGPGRGAAGALRAWDEAFATWSSVLDAVPEESLATGIGAVGGSHARSTRRAPVLHLLDELTHHGAEVGLVRDLWAARTP